MDLFTKQGLPNTVPGPGVVELSPAPVGRATHHEVVEGLHVLKGAAREPLA